MGHLYRQLSFYQNYSNLIDFKFIAVNELQRDFYKSLDCEYINILEEKCFQEFDFGIYDSKEDFIDVYDKIKHLSKTWIAIDSTKKWIKEFDYAVYPSFFASLETIPMMLQEFDTKLLFGTEYVLARKAHRKDDANTNFNTLVTFGGADPNNLTELVAKIVTKRPDYKDFVFLIGPNFINKKEFFESKYKKLNFLSPVNSTRTLIEKSNCVISSLGTTLQECEYFSKNTILITNYLSDEDDAKILNNYSINENTFYYLGHFKDINENAFNNIYNKHTRNLNKNRHDGSKWGTGWDSLLEINEQK